MRIIIRSMVRLSLLLISAGFGFIIGCTDTPRVHPPVAPTPIAPSWRRLQTYRWSTTDGTVILRFAPAMDGLPTVHTVVDTGSGADEIWYLPWVHDHPNPTAEPLPTSYIAALTDALVHFGAQVDVVGVEGDLWEWDLRHHEISPHACKAITATMIDIVLATYADAGDLECAAAPILDGRPKLEQDGLRTHIARVEREFLVRTTTPIIGVEDPNLILQETGAKNPTLDRERSSTAVAVLLAETRARGGHRALLAFGMAHYAEIEHAVRQRENITLRVACIPALCEIKTHDE